MIKSVYNRAVVSFSGLKPWLSRALILFSGASLLLASFCMGFQTARPFMTSTGPALTAPSAPLPLVPLAEGALAESGSPMFEEDETEGELHSTPLFTHLLTQSEGLLLDEGTPLTGHPASLHRPPWA